MYQIAFTWRRKARMKIKIASKCVFTSEKAHLLQLHKKHSQENFLRFQSNVKNLIVTAKETSCISDQRCLPTLERRQSRKREKNKPEFAYAETIQTLKCTNWMSRLHFLQVIKREHNNDKNINISGCTQADRRKTVRGTTKLQEIEVILVPAGNIQTRDQNRMNTCESVSECVYVCVRAWTK